jgi:glutamyl-tRNA reductase
MSQGFRCLSISHITAPVSIRELFHVPKNEISGLLCFLHEQSSVDELLLVSTCNRTELYYSSAQNKDDLLFDLLCGYRGISSGPSYRSYFESYQTTAAASLHLFRVAMGLEATVLGDIQISGQVKEAYSYAHEAKLAGPFLHRLLHTIFHTNKRVQQETAFRSGAASVSYASVELAQELCVHLNQPKVLVIGFGEMGKNVAQNLLDNTEMQVSICNRTISKVQDFANTHQMQVLSWDELPASVADFDVILSTVGLDEYVVKSEYFPNDLLKTKYLIDLGVPRSIDVTLGKKPGIVLYNIDEIQNKVNEALAQRQESIAEVEKIIQEEHESFLEWAKSLIISPIIQELRNALEVIRNEEMAKYLKNATEEQIQVVEAVTKGMVQRILKMPVMELKEACKRGEQDQLIGSLRDLFNLERNKVKS